MFSEQYEFYISDFEKKLEFIKNREDIRVIRGDLINFIEDLFISIGQHVNIREIETLLNDIQKIDFKTIKEALDLFDNPDFMDKEFISDKGIEIKFKTAFDNLQNFLNTIKTNETKLGITEVLLRLELVANRAFEQMIYVLGDDAPIAGLHELLKTKLVILSDNDIKILWAHVKSEFGEENYNFVYDKAILGKNFFEFKNVDQLREKIVNYISILRPKILLNRFKEGISTSPHLSFGIARILAMVGHYSRDLSFNELAIVKIINRIIEFLEKVYFYYDKSRIFSYLGISPAGRIASLKPRDIGDDLDNVWFDFSRTDIESTKQSHKIILYELRRFLNIVNNYITYQTNVEKALKQYKLTYEIFAKENFYKFSKKKSPNELFLQKDLCAFLLERDIYSYGKKFGASEIDLMVEQPGEVFVIETKIYKSNLKLATLEKHIEKDLIQLSEYLEKETSSARGILVIYNVTNVLIETPKIWIQKRFWILPINISELTASQRRKCIKIEEADTKKIIRCIANDEEPKNRKNKPKK